MPILTLLGSMLVGAIIAYGIFAFITRKSGETETPVKPKRKITKQ